MFVGSPGNEQTMWIKRVFYKMQRFKLQKRNLNYDGEVPAIVVKNRLMKKAPNPYSQTFEQRVWVRIRYIKKRMLTSA